MPRLHFQQRHIRFSSRRFWLGFVCSGGQAPAHFYSFSSSAQTPGEGRRARAGDARSWPGPGRGPLPGLAVPEPHHPPHSSRLQRGPPTRARPGGDTSLGVSRQPPGDAGPLVSPRVWLGTRAKGMRNREPKNTNLTFGEEERAHAGDTGAWGPRWRGHLHLRGATRWEPAIDACRCAWPRPRGLSRLPEKRPRSGLGREPQAGPLASGRQSGRCPALRCSRFPATLGAARVWKLLGVTSWGDWRQLTTQKVGASRPGSLPLASVESPPRSSGRGASAPQDHSLRVHPRYSSLALDSVLHSRLGPR